MLVKDLQPHIVERIVAKNGKRFVLRVALIDIDGKRFWRVLSATEIQTLRGTKPAAKILCLCGDRNSGEFCATEIFESPLVSPYTNFDFFTSQMTRAPSFI